MNRCTLIVDGNWLMMSRLPATYNQFRSECPEFIKEQAVDNLVDSMLSSINVVLQKFTGIVDNMIFVADGFSWRKTLEVPEQLGDTRYKGNRVKTEEMDWSYIYKSIDRIIEGLEKNNCTVSRSKSAEGDDWMWYWSNRLNTQGINCIIWSTDNDLKQLVKYDGCSFTAWYNDFNGLFLDKSMDEEEVSDIDFFMQFSNNATFEMLKSSVHQVSYIEPAKIVMDKIICGDTSDNIKSVIVQEKGGKQYRITEKFWNAVREDLKIDTLDEFFQCETLIVEELISRKNSSRRPEDIYPCFDYNKRLVWLDESSYPPEVLMQMENSEYKQFDIDFVLNNYKTMDVSYQNDDVVGTFLSMAGSRVKTDKVNG